jgi:CRISPR type IV-associated protein Csf3
MQPLRIRCRPANAVVWYDRWLPLDGVIGHGWMLDRYGVDFYALPTLTPISTGIDLIEMTLPLEQRAANTAYWYWAASWCDMDAATISRSRNAWVRGYPFADAGFYIAESERKKKRSVSTVAGPDKLYNVPVYERTCAELAWYAVGDAAEITRLLALVPHIGKKCSCGWGQLMPYADGALWQVEPWPVDWSERDTDGNLTRGLPAQAVFDAIDWFSGEGAFTIGNYQQFGYRVPYFVQLNQAMLEMPK